MDPEPTEENITDWSLKTNVGKLISPTAPSWHELEISIARPRKKEKKTEAKASFLHCPNMASAGQKQECKLEKQLSKVHHMLKLTTIKHNHF